MGLVQGSVQSQLKIRRWQEAEVRVCLLQACRPQHDVTADGIPSASGDRQGGMGAAADRAQGKPDSGSLSLSA